MGGGALRSTNIDRCAAIRRRCCRALYMRLATLQPRRAAGVSAARSGGGGGGPSRCPSKPLALGLRAAAGMASDGDPAQEDTPHPAAPAAEASLSAVPAQTAVGGPPAGAGQVVLQYSRLVPALLLRRYKRFLGDVQLTPDGVPAAAAAADVVAEADMAAAGAAVAVDGDDNAATVIHVPNTGPMTGLLDSLPAQALLSHSSDPKRKYAHTLEWLQPGPQGAHTPWVGTHSAKANAMVRCLLEQRLLPQLLPYASIQPEVKYGADGKSRVDFLLHPSSNSDGIGSAGEGAVPAAPGGRGSKGSKGSKGGKRKRGVQAVGSRIAADGSADGVAQAAQVVAAGELGTAAAAEATATGTAAAARVVTAGSVGAASCCYVEVKSVTLAEDQPQGAGRIALFPDTVSLRAQRHVRELTGLARAGQRAALVFVVQREDCTVFAPCHEKDRVYGQLVREAAAAGVLLLPVLCGIDVQAGAVRYLGTLPVDLDYKWHA